MFVSSSDVFLFKHVRCQSDESFNPSGSAVAALFVSFFLHLLFCLIPNNYYYSLLLFILQTSSQNISQCISFILNHLSNLNTSLLRSYVHLNPTVHPSLTIFQSSSRPVPLCPARAVSPRVASLLGSPNRARNRVRCAQRVL